MLVDESIRYSIPCGVNFWSSMSVFGVKWHVEGISLQEQIVQEANFQTSCALLRHIQPFDWDKIAHTHTYNHLYMLQVRKDFPRSLHNILKVRTLVVANVFPPTFQYSLMMLGTQPNATNDAFTVIRSTRNVKFISWVPYNSVRAGETTPTNKCDIISMRVQSANNLHR